MKSLPDFHKIAFDHFEPQPWKSSLPQDVAEFLSLFIKYQDSDRISAQKALLHALFTMDPKPLEAIVLLK
jgi:hypothetical protein